MLYLILQIIGIFGVTGVLASEFIFKNISFQLDLGQDLLLIFSVISMFFGASKLKKNTQKDVLNTKNLGTEVLQRENEHLKAKIKTLEIAISKISGS